jgi:putative sigma-54 modulation protein
MDVSVIFRQLEPTEALRQYAADKCERLKKYIPLPADVHVILAKHKHLYQAEIKVTHGAAVMKGAHRADDMYSCIDLAVDKVERQASRFKERKRSKRPGAAEDISVRHAVLQAESQGEPPTRLINSEEVPAKPMTIDEAIMQMEAQQRDFFVFSNSASGEINVIYRRRDGNIGLIETEHSKK